jgi:Icc-related predicted phosphoesterase
VAAQGAISALKEIRYSLYEIKAKGETDRLVRKLLEKGCKVEETEDQLLKVYMPANLDRKEIFRLADQEQVQIRYFIKSQTSLEDLFAQTVGVD